jgi:hypothetical protein
MIRYTKYPTGFFCLLLAGVLLLGSSESTRPEAGYSGYAIPQDETDETLEAWLEDGLRYWRQVQEVPALIAWYAERQLGIDYKAGLLDEPDEEQLVVTLEGSDCVIYVETSLALAMTTLQGRQTADAFRDNLTFLRYRDGEVDGYMSRLHYFSDWLLTNRDKGLLAMLFQDEDLPVMDPVHFMSDNRDSYRHLAANDELYEEKRRVEALLSERKLRYIPQERIPDYEAHFRTGDILAFVTTIEGLDVTHTALVKVDDGRAGFYHASTTGAVIIDPGTIYEYTKNRRNVNGIVVARLQSPQP